MKKEEKREKPKVYKVPAAVASDMATGRGVFTHILAKQVKSGEVTLEIDVQADLLTLIADLLTDANDTLRKLNFAEERFSDLYTTLRRALGVTKGEIEEEGQ